MIQHEVKREISIHQT